ncbi:acetate--CoA ligase family protein [Patescibacteria group bacterium]|nr:acetate--CoA ligase family protein [Patescibacteria group bacterium]
MKNLDNFFNPQSIAIVGASEEHGKIGHIIAKNLLELGYAGKVFLVNPKHENILGQKCYKSVLEISEEVDLVIMVIPAKIVNDVIKSTKDKIKNYVVISAGFGEMNEEGKAREEELRQIAKENDLNILGPNCLGFIIPNLKLNASFAGGLPEVGNVAFVSQSGALAVGLMDVAKKEGLRFSSIISIGNKMQMGEAELLEYLEADANTKVIGLYLEGIRDGRKFIEVAQKIQKPIVILKAGKTERAQKAISLHTGALAGSDEIMNAVFAKTGIIRAENMDEFLGLLKLISSLDAPQNEEVVIITNAGGLGVLTTDAFQNKKIKLAEIGEKTQLTLRKFLPEASSVANPIDLLGDADEKRYAETLKVMKKGKAGTIICLLTPQDQTPVKKIAGKIAKFKEKASKNIVTVFMGGERVAKAMIKLKENNIPNFFLSEQAVNLLDKYWKWSVGKNTADQEETSMEIISERQNKALGIINQAKAQGKNALVFPEAVEIMKLYGIGTVDFWTEAQLDAVRFPVVVKVDSDKVLHKTDKKGLILNLKNQEELEKAIAEIKQNFPGEKIIIQPMIEGGTELILGIKKDEIFGPVIIFGLGGIYTEIFQAVDFIIPYSDKEEIKDILLNGKSEFLFKETRGKIACDLEEVAQIIFKLQALALEVDQIKELDINPLISLGKNKNSLAVDVKIII